MKWKLTVDDFIANPSSLWNNQLAEALVSDKLEKLKIPYSLSNCVLKSKMAYEKTYTLSPSPIKLVFPSADLNIFYEKHGLKPFALDESSDFAIRQLQNAIEVFKISPEIQSFIFTIVESIQLLKADNTETDVSYSHPDIPLSIFISICESDTIISNIRVAESILHESMHLLLTLIEGVVPLVYPDSKEVFYSPWRDEERPIRGVMHGLFVFTSILSFYELILIDSSERDMKTFANDRILSIKREIQTLSALPQSNGLTNLGKKLTYNLLNKN